MEISFIKLRVDMFDDEKIKIIEQSQDGILVIYVWVRLLALAGKKNEGGYIIIFPGLPTSVEHLASIMNKPIGIIAQAINVLLQTGLITTDPENGYLYITNWEKHQSIEKLEKIREQNNVRKQRYRMNQKQKMLTENEKRNVPVTFRNATEEDIRDKSKKKETEKSVTVADNYFNLLIKYEPTDFTEDEKKERMSQMYNEMKNSSRITLLARDYSRTETTIKEHLSNFIRERFLTDDCHHSITQYWHYFNLYLKKINL